MSIWIDEAVDTRRSWDDLIDSGHADLITLDFKLADGLNQFFKADNPSESAQRLFLKKGEQMKRTKQTNTQKQ